MNKIMKRFRVFSILVLLLIVASATSSSQLAPDAHDDLLTYIKNSNGNYWMSTGENIQVALNDLDNTSGTVWLPGSTTLTVNSTIILWNNVILDMGGISVSLLL